MEPSTFALVAALVVVGTLAIWATRRRRDDGLTPARLGPAWEPRATDGASVATAPDLRVEILQQRTGCDGGTVATVLAGWDEHLAVLGLLSLPPGHRYQVYDPYDRPVASRGADNRPVADPARVVRDVANRTGTAEVDARTVLDALLSDPEDGHVDQRS